jgi:hypothetical protein
MTRECLLEEDESMKMEMKFLFLEEMAYLQPLITKSIQNTKQIFNLNFWVNLERKKKIKESPVLDGFQKIVC